MSRLSRLREELRQRRHHREFRIPPPMWDEPRRGQLEALLAEVRTSAERVEKARQAPPSPPGPEPRPGLGLDEKALATAATNLWRAQRKLVQRTESSSPQARQAARYLRGCAEALTEAGLTVQDHDSELFQSGHSLEVLAFEDDATLARETVLQTVRPSVYLGEKRIQMGQVIVGCPPDRPADGATPPDPEHVRNHHDA